MKTVLTVLVAAVLASCSNGPESRAADNASTASSADLAGARQELRHLAGRRATPDEAVNSFFQAAVVQNRLNCYETARAREEMGEDATAAFYDGAALEYRSQIRRSTEECVARSGAFRADISNVDMQSATFSVVTVVVRNTEAVPAGADADDWMREARRNGTEFRFQLAKAQSGWRIRQVLEKDRIGEQDRWRPLYEPGPSYPWSFFLPLI